MYIYPHYDTNRTRNIGLRQTQHQHDWSQGSFSSRCRFKVDFNGTVVAVEGAERVGEKVVGNMRTWHRTSIAAFFSNLCRRIGIGVAQHGSGKATRASPLYLFSRSMLIRCC
jgi:hypothetical protein